MVDVAQDFFAPATSSAPEIILLFLKILRIRGVCLVAAARLLHIVYTLLYFFTRRYIQPLLKMTHNMRLLVHVKD